MKVLVTGATGFVGSHLVKTLLDKGIDVTGAVRPGSAESVRIQGAEYVSIEDPYSPQAWGRLLGKADAVVHLIGKTHSSDIDDKTALPLYRKINVGITEALLEASRKQGVKQFVYLSSIKAVGEGADFPYTEETPCHPKDAYGISKLEAESLVREQRGIQTVVIRPPLVYGPRVKGNFLRLLKAVNNRIPLPFGALSNKRSLLYVINLSEAITLFLRTEKIVEGIFHVADKEVVSTKDIVLLMAKALGIEPRLISMPPFFLHMLGRIGRKEHEINKITGTMLVCSEKIEEEMNWIPECSFFEGIMQTAEWFRTGSI
jgi:nucleoside-diphosphate-sugar epimerase